MTMAKKLAARPKTTPGLQRRTTDYAHLPDSRCSIHILGEGLAASGQQSLPHPQLQLLLNERPSTSIVRDRAPQKRQVSSGKEKLDWSSGKDVAKQSSSRERRVFLMVPGKEFPLPVCKGSQIVDARSPGASRDTPAVLTSRQQSAIAAASGSTGPFFLDPSARGRSTSVLTELSLSLDFSQPSFSKLVLKKPVRGSRERVCRQSGNSGTVNNGDGDECTLSSYNTPASIPSLPSISSRIAEQFQDCPTSSCSVVDSNFTAAMNGSGMLNCPERSQSVTSFQEQLLELHKANLGDGGEAEPDDESSLSASPSKQQHVPTDHSANPHCTESNFVNDTMSTRAFRSLRASIVRRNPSLACDGNQQTIGQSTAEPVRSPSEELDRETPEAASFGTDSRNNSPALPLYRDSSFSGLDSILTLPVLLRDNAIERPTRSPELPGKVTTLDMAISPPRSSCLPSTGPQTARSLGRRSISVPDSPRSGAESPTSAGGRPVSLKDDAVIQQLSGCVLAASPHLHTAASAPVIDVDLSLVSPRHLLTKFRAGCPADTDKGLGDTDSDGFLPSTSHVASESDKSSVYETDADGGAMKVDAPGAVIESPDRPGEPEKGAAAVKPLAGDVAKRLGILLEIAEPLPNRNTKVKRKTSLIKPSGDKDCMEGRSPPGRDVPDAETDTAVKVGADLDQTKEGCVETLRASNTANHSHCDRHKGDTQHSLICQGCRLLAPSSSPDEDLCQYSSENLENECDKDSDSHRPVGRLSHRETDARPTRKKLALGSEQVPDVCVVLACGVDSLSGSSSSTAGVTFSSDLLYGHGEGSGLGVAGSGSGVKGQADEVAASELATWDVRAADKRLKELDLHGNKRPTSRNSGRKVPSYEKAPFERDRDELRPLANSLVAAKQSSLRANGIVKSNLLRVDQILNQRANGSAGREEELVAMGTLWGPGQLPIRGSSTGTTTTTSSSGKSSSGAGVLASFSSSVTVTYNSSSAPAPVPARRPTNLSTSTSTRQLLHQNSTASSSWSGSTPMGNIIRSSNNGSKEVEPKYGDPLSGAPASFQQRLMELAALEAETVRWERSKKVKKKQSKQDRDS